MDNDNLKLYLGFDLETSDIAIVCAETQDQACEVYIDEHDIEIEPQDWYELTESDLPSIRAHRLGKEPGRVFTSDEWLAFAAYEPGFLDYVDADESLLHSLDARAAG